MGIGLGAGLGAGVGVVMLDTSTIAEIADATVDALANRNDTTVLGGTDNAGLFTTTSARGVIVQSRSRQDFTHLALAGGGGFVGVAGAVGISILDSDTTAAIRSGAAINQTGNNTDANSLQSVLCQRGHEYYGFSFAGALGFGLGSLAGAVDIGTLKNDTLAIIETNAEVRAKNDVVVNLAAYKDIDGYAFSGAGGAIALAASVSVWSVGTQIERTYTDRNGTSADAQAIGSDRADLDSAGKSMIWQ